LPYLDFIAERAGTKLSLGRDGSELTFNDYDSKFRKDGSQSYTYRKPNVCGREVIDTLFLSWKYDSVARKLSAYGLKTVVKELGLEDPNRQHYDAKEIQTRYLDRNEFDKIRAYCQGDSDDALKIFELMIPPYFYMVQTIPTTLEGIVNRATGSQINSYLIRSYLIEGHSIPKPSDPVDFEGAISLGNPGTYRNVLKVDVASLYPSIMLEYSVFNPEKDPLGIFLITLQELTEQRLKNKTKYKETKDEYYKALSESIKIVINSFYGFMGAPGLHFNSPKHAALVTEKGREILTIAIDWCEKKGFILVNADTDSIAFCKADHSFMAESERSELLSELNSLFQARIRWENDGYYDAVLVIKAKNYVMKQGDKLTIKGSALKATMKEPALRECLRRLVEAMLDGRTSAIEAIKEEYTQEIENLTDITRWAAKKTVTEKVMNPGRTNEAKILAAISETDFQEGDKVYVYFAQDQSLKLAKDWNHDHCKKRLQKKLKDTLAILFGKVRKKKK